MRPGGPGRRPTAQDGNALGARSETVSAGRQGGLKATRGDDAGLRLDKHGHVPPPSSPSRSLRASALRAPTVLPRSFCLQTVVYNAKTPSWATAPHHQGPRVPAAPVWHGIVCNILSCATFTSEHPHPNMNSHTMRIMGTGTNFLNTKLLYQGMNDHPKRGLARLQARDVGSLWESM